MFAGNCGQGVLGEVVGGKYVVASSCALQCPLCGEISARSKQGVVCPPPTDRQPVQHLPLDVDSAWREAVDAFNAGAFTAAEIMCRKILMHVAVDVAKSPEGQNFVQYIKRPRQQGIRCDRPQGE